MSVQALMQDYQSIGEHIDTLMQNIATSKGEKTEVALKLYEMTGGAVFEFGGATYRVTKKSDGQCYVRTAEKKGA